tara:strand:- start:11 stop:550 length:540 start_codon:yes stop_codon:yes gene_type:complete
MKRSLVVFVALGLLAGLVGCGDSSSPEEKAEREALDWLVDYNYAENQAEWDGYEITSVPIKDLIRECVYETRRNVDEAFVEENRPADYPAYEDGENAVVGTDKWLRNYYRVTKWGLVLDESVLHDAYRPLWTSLSDEWWYGSSFDDSPYFDRNTDRDKAKRKCYSDLLTAEEFVRATSD